MMHNFPLIGYFNATQIIIIIILRGGRDKWKRLQNRLLLPMSVFDIVQSIGYAFSTLPIPRGSLCTYGAIGNKVTCAIQGVAIQLGFIVPSYNALLCIYYLSVIKWNIPDRRMKEKEKFMHIVAIVPSFAAAIYGLAFSMFNNASLHCGISSSDKYLPSSSSSGNKDWPTTIIVYYICLSIIVFAIFAIVVFSMTSLYRSVKQKENQMMKYDFRASRSLEEGRQNRKTPLQEMVKDTKQQAFLYVGAFFITYLFPLISVILGIFLNRPTPFAIRLLHGIFLPLQGFWNCIAFIRPRFKIISLKNPNKYFLQKVILAILHTPRDKHVRSRDLHAYGHRHRNNKSRSSHNTDMRNAVVEEEDSVSLDDEENIPSVSVEEEKTELVRDESNYHSLNSYTSKVPVTFMKGQNNYKRIVSKGEESNSVQEVPMASLTQSMGSRRSRVTFSKEVSRSSLQSLRSKVKVCDQTSLQEFITLSSLVAQDILGQCSTCSTPRRQRRLSVDTYSMKRDCTIAASLELLNPPPVVTNERKTQGKMSSLSIEKESDDEIGKKDSQGNGLKRARRHSMSSLLVLSDALDIIEK